MYVAKTSTIQLTSVGLTEAHPTGIRVFLCPNQYHVLYEDFCSVHSDEDETAKLLIDSGANVNSKNGKGATPLIIAAVKGHYSVLRILTNHPDIKLHEQVHRVCNFTHNLVLH